MVCFIHNSVLGTVVATAIAVSVAGGASASPSGNALHKCIDALFGGGSLTCTVEKDDVFGGLSSMGNDKEKEVEAALNHIAGAGVDIDSVTTGIERLIAGDFTITPADGVDKFGDFTTFDWSYAGDAALAVLTVKAGTGFAIFDIMGLTSGSASTDGLLVNHRGNALDVSHLSFWSTVSTVGGPGGSDRPGPQSVVPEPGVLALGVVGFAGLVMLRRRNR